MSDLQFPIGRFTRPAAISAAERLQFLQEIEGAPARFALAVTGLTEEQLNTPYREGGWTVRQVVHHVADSHMHSYIRCKFAFNEDNPTIKPYDEAAWAKYDDAVNSPVEVSLALIANLHYRWVRWFRSLPESAFARTLFHPENGEMNLDTMVALYAWHGRHHAAHITGLRERKGWSITPRQPVV